MFFLHMVYTGKNLPSSQKQQEYMSHFFFLMNHYLHKEYAQILVILKHFYQLYAKKTSIWELLKNFASKANDLPLSKNISNNVSNYKISCTI
jgi:hypothetical protein